MDFLLPPEIVFANKLIEYSLAFENEIIEVLALNARWEIWLQIQLARVLKKNGFQVELETGYTSNKQRLDIKVCSNNEVYAIELKVESSVHLGYFAGRELIRAGGDDIFKLQDELKWKDVPEKNKLCMMVAHSKKSLEILRELFNDQPPSHYDQGKYIGVAVYYAYYY